MLDSAVVLAGGLSSRYGKNKILETFKGKTLIDYALTFCKENSIPKQIVVYFDEAIAQHLKKVYPVKIREGSLILTKRPESPEGTGMSLRTGARFSDKRFIVLFADNFYQGTFHDEGNANEATYVEKTAHKDNLRFAAVIEDKIVEKPHAYESGKFFVGYMIFNKEDVLSQEIILSKRGEVEITDIFNRCKNKKIKALDLIWEEITYLDDYEKMSLFIEKIIKDN